MNAPHSISDRPAWPTRRKPALADIWLAAPMTEAARRMDWMQSETRGYFDRGVAA